MAGFPRAGRTQVPQVNGRHGWRFGQQARAYNECCCHSQVPDLAQPDCMTSCKAPALSLSWPHLPRCVTLLQHLVTARRLPGAASISGKCGPNSTSGDGNAHRAVGGTVSRERLPQPAAGLAEGGVRHIPTLFTEKTPECSAALNDRRLSIDHGCSPSPPTCTCQ
jgi:hypothetical protein